MTTKVCSKCKVEKDVGDFHSNKRREFGVDYFCKACRNAYNREYYGHHLDEQHARAKKYANDHKDELKEKKKLAYIENKERYDARIAAYSKTEAGKAAARRGGKNYAIRHPERLKVMRQNNQKTHRPERAAYASKYRKTPNGKLLDARHRHRRTALEKNTECTLTLKQWNRILSMQNNRCAICKCEFNADIKPTRDHIIPISLGGGLTLGNVQALCVSCNSSKGNRVFVADAIGSVLVQL
jgi:5-methylcytosine-specific restriction endonuclease McrA